MNIPRHQVFKVSDGKWFEVNHVYAPDPEPLTYFAIIDEKAYPVEFKFLGNNTILFKDGYGDGELKSSYDIIANGVRIGGCSKSEY